MEDLPPALQTGSPLYGRGEGPFSQPPGPRRISSKSSFVSDLSRHSSYDSPVGEPFSATAVSRYSHLVSPNVGPETPYDPTNTPSLPSFPEDTSYSPLVSPTIEQGAPPTFRRNRSLLSKLGSIRSNRFTNRSRYGQLSGGDGGAEQSGDLGRRTLGGLEEEEDDEEGIGFDISGFEGPIQMQEISRKPPPAITIEEEPRGFSHPGMLGGGMNLVRTATVAQPPSQHGHRRVESRTDPETRKAAQRLAQSRGEILAVEAEPVVDISGLDDSGFTKRNTVTSSIISPDGDKNKDKNKSYFFPQDPEQPAWRPFSMRWPYITMLIILAVFLASIQEYLCQLSLQRAKTNDGLIQFTHPQDIPTDAYFAWKYMPTIILVTYGVLWQVTDYETKRLEPYYQLSKREGATAAHSLNLDYLTFMSYLIPIRAIAYKQWAVVFSSIATLIAGGLLAVLQSASIVMTPEKDQRQPDEIKNVNVNPIWSRFLEAALLIIAILGVLLLIQLRRKSGLLSDPKGIAGIAAMATKSHILNDFKGLDTASNHIIHDQLRNRRYNLHKSSLWQGEYMPSTGTTVTEHKIENPHPIMLRLHAGIPYIVFMFAFLALLPCLLFVGNASVVTEKVPFLLTAIATSIKLLWGCLDMNVRVVEPYYILSKRHAPPRTLTLDYTGTVPGYLSVKAALNKHYLVSFVGLGAILAEVLTVCVTSFSVDGRSFVSGHALDSNGSEGGERYNSGETFRSFWISLALSIGILLYLITLASLVYHRRRHPFLPRQPGESRLISTFMIFD